MLSLGVENNEGKQSHEKRDEDIRSGAMPVCYPTNHWRTHGARSSDYSEETGYSTSVMVGRSLQEKDQGSPECAEDREEESSDKSRLPEQRLGPNKHYRRTKQYRP